MNTNLALPFSKLDLKISKEIVMAKTKMLSTTRRLEGAHSWVPCNFWPKLNCVFFDAFDFIST